MTEKSGTPAPAVESSVPAVAPPSERSGVDLSDLQAELDSRASQADEDEIFDDIAGKSKDDGDDADAEDDADPADEAVDGDEDEEKDEDADADAEDKPRKRSRAARYRDQIARLEHENAQLR